MSGTGLSWLQFRCLYCNFTGGCGPATPRRVKGNILLHLRAEYPVCRSSLDADAEVPSLAPFSSLTRLEAGGLPRAKYYIGRKISRRPPIRVFFTNFHTFLSKGGKGVRALFLPLKRALTPLCRKGRKRALTPLCQLCQPLENDQHDHENNDDQCDILANRDAESEPPEHADAGVIRLKGAPKGCV